MVVCKPHSPVSARGVSGTAAAVRFVLMLLSAFLACGLTLGGQTSDCWRRRFTGHRVVAAQMSRASRCEAGRLEG